MKLLILMSLTASFLFGQGQTNRLQFSPQVTAATLPTCNGGASGLQMVISDGPTITGGGSTPTPVFCNGSAWAVVGSGSNTPSLSVRGQGTILFAHIIPDFTGVAWQGYQPHLSVVTPDGKTFQTLKPDAFYQYMGSGNQTFQDTGISITYPSDAPSGIIVIAGDGHDNYSQMQMITAPTITDLANSTLITLNPRFGAGTWNANTTYSSTPVNASPYLFGDLGAGTFRMYFQAQSGGSGPFIIYESHPTVQTLAGLSGTWTQPVAITGNDYIDPCVLKIGSTYHLFAKENTGFTIQHGTSSSATGPFTLSNIANIPVHRERPSVVQLDANTYAMFLDYEFGTQPYVVSYSTDVSGLSTWSVPVTINEPSGSAQGNAGSYYIRAGSVMRTVDPYWMQMIQQAINVHPGYDNGFSQYPIGNSFVTHSLLAGIISQNGNKVPSVFFGTSAPGSVTGNLAGDLYSDTTNHNLYQCNSSNLGGVPPVCTSVTTGGWTLLNTSGGGGGGSTGFYCNATGGASNLLTCSPSPSLTSYTAGQVGLLKVDAANTSSVTINISGLGFVPLYNAGAILSSGVLQPGTGTGLTYTIQYDGSRFNITGSYLVSLPAWAGSPQIYGSNNSGDPLEVVNNVTFRSYFCADAYFSVWNPFCGNSTTPSALTLTFLDITQPLSAQIGGGTTFTASGSGCTATPVSGGSQVGKFTATSGTCTVTITTGTTAANGFACWANNLTTPSHTVQQTGGNTTTAVFSVTPSTTETINFGCLQY